MREGKTEKEGTTGRRTGQTTHDKIDKMDYKELDSCLAVSVVVKLPKSSERSKAINHGGELSTAEILFRPYLRPGNLFSRLL